MILRPNPSTSDLAYLLDTNIISYMARSPQGPVAARAAAAAPDELLVSVIVLGEIAYGFSRQPAPKLQRQANEIIAAMLTVGIGEEVASRYGRVRATLEAKGTPIGNNDMWIAAHALALDATLVTANEREFRRVPGLKVENWAA